VTVFEDLYERYARSLYRFALSLCGAHAEAEDIVSETFVRAWNTPSPIRTSTAKAYLFTIARHCYLQRARQAWRRRDLDDQIGDPGRQADEAVVQKDEVARVWQALGRLPEVDRSALLMRALEDMSYQEIADALDLTVAAVKTKIHRARLKLAPYRDGAEVPR
jgi:RNA polymerase sigma-70 factor (ECF subfamily)